LLRSMSSRYISVESQDGVFWSIWLRSRKSFPPNDRYNGEKIKTQNIGKICLHTFFKRLKLDHFFALKIAFTQARVSSGICSVCAFFVFFTRSHPNVLQTSRTLGDDLLFQVHQKGDLYIRIDFKACVYRAFFKKKLHKIHKAIFLKLPI